MFMSGETIRDDFELSHEKLLEYSEHTMADFIMEIHDLRAALEEEKKSHAVAKHHRLKAEERVAELEEQINTAITALQTARPKEED